jgi:hypothetical protein
VGEQRQIDHRLCRCPLDADECGEGEDRRDDRADDEWLSEARFLGVGQSCEETQEGDEEGDGASPVETLGSSRTGVRHETDRGDRADDADREVHEEYQPPRGHIDEEAPEHRPCDDADRHHRPIDAECLPAFAGRKCLGRDGKAKGEDHRGAHGLEDPRKDEELDGGSEACDHGECSEDGETCREDRLLADHVTQPAESERQGRLSEEVSE